MSTTGMAGVPFGRGSRRPGSRRGLHKVLLAVVVVALVASVTPLVSKSDVVAAEETPPPRRPPGSASRRFPRRGQDHPGGDLQ